MGRKEGWVSLTAAWQSSVEAVSGTHFPEFLIAFLAYSYLHPSSATKQNVKDSIHTNFKMNTLIKDYFEILIASSQILISVRYGQSY